MEYEYREPKPPSDQQRTREETAYRACGCQIGVDDRLLTWRIREGATVFEYHYCSDDCLPESAPETPSIDDGVGAAGR